MYVKADFAYEAGSDVYRCPAGEALSYRYTTEEDGLQLRRYWTSDCQACPLQSGCTTGKELRITRWEHEHLIEASAARLQGPSEPMTVRRSTVEHPFGTIKSWMGATHFLTRGLRHVKTPQNRHKGSPRPATLGNEGKGKFVNADFFYDPERGVCRCLAGRR